ncbi:hypothetical protein [Methanococcus voltae]|uniref:Uncharacterized protein n=1 Tax=Methanococcus voltae (strain ATCC BAA-1334 / A3) TaxID=456320 RepID=D7DSK1_METV3|nr:hypothetical protein [Methanococcus voltae]MCS3901710.1 hypothetical protein [Methanococcus voltae]
MKITANCTINDKTPAEYLKEYLGKKDNIDVPIVHTLKTNPNRFKSLKEALKYYLRKQYVKDLKFIKLIKEVKK